VSRREIETRNGKVVFLEDFPFYYGRAAQFLLNGAPSGAIGAEAQLTISVNNWPQVATALRFFTTYQIDDEDFQNDPAVYNNLRPLDDHITVEVTLAQQNITSQPLAVPILQGVGGTVYHPLVSDYLWRGGNQITIRARRLTSYPGTFSVPITPTLHAGIVVVVGISDQLPGSAPGSSGRP